MMAMAGYSWCSVGCSRRSMTLVPRLCRALAGKQAGVLAEGAAKTGTPLTSATSFKSDLTRFHADGLLVGPNRKDIQGIL